MNNYYDTIETVDAPNNRLSILIGSGVGLKGVDDQISENNNPLRIISMRIKSETKNIISIK
jgi:hypothetical protein